MKNFNVLMIIAILVLVIGCTGSPSETQATSVEAETAQNAEGPDSTVADRHDLVYVCACGPDCTCNSVATEPGNCTCGTELVQAHLVKVEGHEGLLCTCGNDCTCTIDAEDAGKCSCGTAIRRVSFEGTGLYFCNCGGTCTCNHVSTDPGQCQCGMDLVATT